MNSELVTRLENRAASRAGRAVLVELIGPLTVVAAAVWAIAQPYRITLLHARDAGFWELVVEPPLLVAAVGLLFARSIAPALVADLEDAAED